MNLSMIRDKNETEDLFYQLVKTVKHLLNKHTHAHKRHWNLRRPNKGKHFIAIHQLKLKKIG